VQGDGKGDSSVDLRARQEMNSGFGSSLSRAFELVLTPVIMGAIGWMLDSRFGTKPFIALGLFLFTLGYVIWKQLTSYEREMKAKEAELFRGHRS
jgi:F0F1-type ATP synthase assembly protein I